MKKKLKSIKENWIFLLVFTLLFIAIIISVFFIVRWNSTRILERAGDQLSTLGSMKAIQISLWKQERYLDAQTIQTDNSFFSQVSQLLADDSNYSLVKESQDRLRSLLLDPNYSAIFLFNAKGSRVLYVGEFNDQPQEQAFTKMEETIQNHEISLTDFYLSEDGTVKMNLIVPIFSTTMEEKPAIAFLVFCIVPESYLYPLIQELPYESESAETVLFQKSDNRVLFLNDLRFKPNAALSFSLPLDQSDSTSVKAVTGTSGIVTGVDYREEPVMAYLTSIPDTDWVLETKEDLREVRKPIRQIDWLVAITAATLLSSVIFSFRFFWRRQTATITRDLSESEMRRKTLEEKYLTLFDQANDAILLVAENGKILEANEKATHLYGYSKEELLSLTIEDIREPTAQSQIAGDMQRVKQKETQYFETIHRKKNGEFFPVDVSSRFITMEGQGFFQSFIRDASRRKKIVQELRESSEALKKAQHLANVGSWYWDMQTNEVKWSEEMFVIFGLPPETQGLNNKIMQEFVHPEDRERVEQITQEALKEHRTYSFDARIIRKDGIERDHWVEAGELFYDQNGELIAISGIVQDITEKKQVEKELRKRENLLQRIFDLLPVGLWITDENGKMINSNKMIKEIWGKDLLVDLDELEVFHGRRLPSMEEIKPDDWASFHTIKEGVTIRDEMIEIDAYDGKTKTILNYSTPILDEKGGLEGSIILNLDISVLRETQRQLTEQLEELRRWNLATLGRENRIRELKSEINKLRKQLGLPSQYPSVEEETN